MRNPTAVLFLVVGLVALAGCTIGPRTTGERPLKAGMYAVFQGPPEGAHPVAWIWVQKGYDFEVQLLYRYGEEGGYQPMGKDAPELHFQWIDGQFGDPNTKQGISFFIRYVSKHYAETYNMPGVDRFAFRILRRQIEEIPPLDLTKPK